MKAVVDQGGWISMVMNYDVRVDISSEGAVRLSNPAQNTYIAVSPCFTQMTAIHPMGRVLRYGPRAEVSLEDPVSVKNAKVHPGGVSFTANNCALVYMLDEAGIRTTSDSFHDLIATEIVEDLFVQSCAEAGPGGVGACIDQLEYARYWRDERSSTDNWSVAGLRLRQTTDGFVTVHIRMGRQIIKYWYWHAIIIGCHKY